MIRVQKKWILPALLQRHCTLKFSRISCMCPALGIIIFAICPHGLKTNFEILFDLQVLNDWSLPTITHLENYMRVLN